MKRFISLFLTLVMIISLFLPTTSYAEGSGRMFNFPCPYLYTSINRKDVHFIHVATCLGSDLNLALKFLLCLDIAMNPFIHIDFSISDSLKTVPKSVLIYEIIIVCPGNVIQDRHYYYGINL